MKGDLNMPSNNNSGSNRTLIPEARQGLNRFKVEVASELGLANYESIDKGNLTSRDNGYVGGTMVKRMVEAYEQGLK
jgi:small acid-soluble spore protein A (major alpha-type SASP)